MQGIFLTLLSIITSHLLLITFDRLCIKKCKIPNLQKCSILVLKFMTFGIYIQQFICSFLIICLSTTTEISLFTVSTTEHIVSLVIAISMLCFLLCFLFYSCYLWYKCKSDSYFDRIIKFKYLFEGSKPNWTSRAKVLKYLIQRLSFCLILSFWNSSNSYAKIGVYCTIQLCCLLYLLYARPFIKVIDNIYEINNDLHYLILCVCLLYLYDRSKWTNLSEVLYVCVISSFNILKFLFLIIYICYIICTKICRKLFLKRNLGNRYEINQNNNPKVCPKKLKDLNQKLSLNNLRNRDDANKSNLAIFGVSNNPASLIQNSSLIDDEIISKLSKNNPIFKSTMIHESENKEEEKQHCNINFKLFKTHAKYADYYGFNRRKF